MAAALHAKDEAAMRNAAERMIAVERSRADERERQLKALKEEFDYVQRAYERVVEEDQQRKQQLADAQAEAERKAAAAADAEKRRTAGLGTPERSQKGDS